MSTTSPLLEVRDVSLGFGGVRALTEVNFHVNKGELFSIIGPNGAGKTSMLNCVSGRYKPTAGRVFFEGRDVTGMTPNQRATIGIGRTFQNLALFGHMSVLDNIMVGRHHLLKNNFLTGGLYWLGAQKEELAHRRKVEDIIDFLEIAHIRKATAGTLSYGLRKRVELARAMAVEPKIILLDEPMAGMNLEEKEDMARYIVDLNEEWGMTVVMIEHDMGVVMDISHRVIVLEFGRKIADGLPDDIMSNERVKVAYLGVDEDDEKAAEAVA
ncbi:ABC transporter ATP-binding protein [Magnetospirillum gryphiswaldense]|jgi:branched-chain amino acid transport system ATP-binding protein|uniref:High-affinity branched-chain amino acid transport ATP-binding protein n=1 Tax=Magnetospirillum gryphiswaldense TaxID=55518 RepID=A4TXS5_9PROT|nr:ABC transporter ATP-binding protein [Magnetospirillum gryphiswaldense]AVM74486.1 Lipopolysaccharide export system ATP-binding protein LptB [Magnetospirillum gryphiswaldense MSR-1]AVM78389.1 Lipopolysaccharide export system ATP-binding protein LptB [Magnetospirillum gryphiswaldense]CAM75432.1 high-affinity branched-chain amino acid transport ATP-binding protein [Magnetospirillum gryphiswaldense MSR-1]